jgi:hypothetical protein
VFERQRKGWRPGVALAAIYLLFIQTLFAGFTQTSHADLSQRDFLGNIICSSSADRLGQDGTNQPSNHEHLPNCCTFGCNMFGPSVAPPPDITVFIQFLPVESSGAVYFSTDIFIAPDRKTPRNTRAPPQAA